MKQNLEILKGIHPGVFLSRELARKDLHSAELAKRVSVHRQNLNAIIKGRRSMNLPLSLRIEKELGLQEGFLMTLQLYFDIEQEKRRLSVLLKPDLSKFRKALFWDIEFSNIDWMKNRSFVIQRVFERGNEEEISETIRFYGKDEILGCLYFGDDRYSVSLKDNAAKYLGYEL